MVKTVIPVNPEIDSQLTSGEVPELESFMRKIIKQGKRKQASPAKRIYEFLSPGLREKLGAKKGARAYSNDFKFELVVALNRILKRADLYNEETWADVELSESLIAAYGEPYAQLGAVDKARLNRQLLHETFPTLVSEPRVPTFPHRPERLHIFGDRFLASGNLQKGITVPFGAVWQPSLFAFGSARSTIQTFGDGLDDGLEYSEWVNRLDINFNLVLTPTERILVGFRPLDEAPDFTGYQFDDIPGREKGFEDYLDGEPQTFFFEGDFGELFPALDPHDRGGVDFGFAVGRQPIRYQNGFMIDDNIDAVGFTKNNVYLPNVSNLRLTGLYGWNEINRNGGAEDEEAQVVALFTSYRFREHIDGSRRGLCPVRL